MTYLFVGAGQAGSALVDAVFDHASDSTFGLFGGKDITSLARPLVFNSTIRDLQNLSNVDEGDQYGISKVHGIVRGDTAGFEEQVAGGFGRNPVDADEVMAEHGDELLDVFEDRFGPTDGSFATDGGRTDWQEFDDESDGEDADGDAWTADRAYDADEWEGEEQFDGEGDDASDNDDPSRTDEIQFAFVFVGLGGGTGCGIAPHIVDALEEYTDGRTDVVAVAVLPNTTGPITDGDEGTNVGAGRQAWNARYGLERLEERVEGIVLVDNQRISYQDAAESQFSEYNEYVAAAVHDLVAGPVLSGVDPSDYDDLDTPDVDVQDIVTSLSFGVDDSESAGYAAIGRSVTMTKSLPGYLLPFVGKRDVDSAALVRLAATKQTLADVDTSRAQKAIALVRAPASYLSGGSRRVETSTIRQYLQSQCALQEVNLGVALNDRDLASVTALVTYGREDVDRLAEIEETAERYEAETEAILQ